MTPLRLVGLLAEPERMRVFAAVVVGAGTPAEVARCTGLDPRTVASALRRLTAAGLLATSEAGLVARPEVFKQTVKDAEQPREQEPLDPDRARAAVLRAFLVDGRLVAIPVTRHKRRIILEQIVTSFVPGVRYPEREVDGMLRAWYPDHAALRRLLVDEDLLAREQNVYWRIGGPVLV